MPEWFGTTVNSAVLSMDMIYVSNYGRQQKLEGGGQASTTCIKKLNLKKRKYAKN
jgi:hypothetical protein